MSKKVIDLLNAARSRELSAITQYMAQHYELEDQDFGKLAKKLKEVGIQEMKHAEALAERILFLKGEPTSKPDAIAKKGQSIADMLKTDMALESAAIKMYNEAAVVCARRKTRSPSSSSRSSWGRKKGISTTLRMSRTIWKKWATPTWPPWPADSGTFSR